MYTFDPTITEMDVPLEATDNLIFSERRKEIQINIVRVEAVDAIGALTSVRGMPAVITVYENDCKLLYSSAMLKHTFYSCL